MSLSLLMLHTDIQLIQNLPRMPRAGIELFTLLLCVLFAFLVGGSLCSSNLENPHSNENVKRFNALVLSKKG